MKHLSKIVYYDGSYCIRNNSWQPCYVINSLLQYLRFVNLIQFCRSSFPHGQSFHICFVYKSLSYDG